MKKSTALASSFCYQRLVLKPTGPLSRQYKLKPARTLLRASEESIEGSTRESIRDNRSKKSKKRIPILGWIEDYESSDAERKQLWKAAIKKSFYWIGWIPVLVGSTAAIMEKGGFPIGRILRMLIGSTCVMAWLNLSNDVYDHWTKVDEQKKESIVNLTGDPEGVHKTSLLFLVAGAAMLGSVIARASSLDPLFLLTMAIACGYLYQGPPFRLSYKGLGEPLCFLAFGPLATTAFYILSNRGRTISDMCWATSAMVGLTTSLILFCSHFHQYESDKAAGKLSPIVRLGGAENSLVVLKRWVYGIFLAGIWSAYQYWLPRIFWIALIPCWMSARKIIKHAENNLTNLEQLRYLKRHAVDFHVFFNLTMIATIFVQYQLM